MKKLIFTLLVFVAIQANSQEIEYFENDPKWRIAYTFGGQYPCMRDYNYTYYLNGYDTIDGVVYNKLYQLGSCIYWEFPSPYPSPDCSGGHEINSFTGLFRQEGKKIYRWEGNQEVMYYDFDLDVGDTLPDSPLLEEDNIYVTAIDSIMIGETYRKVFTLHTYVSFEQPIMIEGLGFISGFLSGFPDYFYPENILCFALGDEIVYYNDLFNGCDIFVGIPAIDESNHQMNIFPNPGNGHFTIRINLEQSTEAYLNVIDVSGRTLIHEYWKLKTGENEKYFDLTDLQTGLYFVTITGANGEFLFRNNILIE
jgi:hypothetical protein